MANMAIISKNLLGLIKMSETQISIKPNNHRIYKCPQEKKIELLNKIISENLHDNVLPKNILIVCSKDMQNIKDALDNKDIKVIEDRELIKDKELSCDFLISFDMPIKNIVYMARIAKTKEKAVMLLDESEQKELYQVEMLLGRAIKQEIIEGFEYARPEPKEEVYGRKPLTKVQIKEVAKQRYEAKTQEPKEQTYDKKPKREYEDTNHTIKMELKKIIKNLILLINGQRRVNLQTNFWVKMTMVKLSFQEKVGIETTVMMEHLVINMMHLKKWVRRLVLKLVNLKKSDFYHKSSSSGLISSQNLN